jgi:SPP1 family predicted phage head-tail adaptor
MQAGKLNERITLQRLATGQDSSGGMVRQWVDLAKDLPASRRDFSGSERPATGAAGGIVAVARTEFTIRWMPGIDATMRVLHEGECHNIQHVNNFAGRRESLILTCETGVNDG